MTNNTSTGRISRRKFLVLAGIAAVGLATGLGTYWAFKRNSPPGLQGVSTTSQGTSTTASAGGVTLSVLGRTAYHQPMNEALFNYVRSKGYNVNFKYDARGYDDEYPVAVLAMRNKSDQYDLVYADEPWIINFFMNGWAAPLGNADLSGIPQHVAQMGHYKGQLYAMPTLGNFNFLFYNRAILDRVNEAPPKSWDDVLRITEEVTSRLGGQGIYGWGGYYPWIADDVFATVLLSMGGHYFDPKDGITPVLDSPAAVEALQIVKELASPKRAHPQIMSWADLTQYSDEILKGHIAVGLVWNGWIAYVDDPSKSSVVGQIGIMPAPGKIKASVSGVWYWFVPSTSKHIDLAVEVVKVMTSFDAQKWAFLNTNRPPTRATVYQDPEVQAKMRLARQYVDVVNAAMPARTSPVWMAVRNDLNSIFQQAVLGKIGVEDAIKQAQNLLVQASRQAGLLK